MPSVSYAAMSVEPLLSLNCTSTQITFTRRVAAAATGVQQRALFKGGAMNNPEHRVAFTRLVAQHVSHRHLWQLPAYFRSGCTT